MNITDKPVLLQFYAEWCGPCKTLSKMIDESINDSTTHVELKRINVDEHHDTGVMPVKDIIAELIK